MAQIYPQQTCTTGILSSYMLPLSAIEDLVIWFHWHNASCVTWYLLWDGEVHPEWGERVIEDISQQDTLEEQEREQLPVIS